MSETEHALQELLAGEVDAVVDPVRGAPIILRQVLAELCRSEARTRLLLERLPVVVWTTDGDLCVTSVAGKDAATMGMTADRVVGRSLADVMEERTGLEGVLAAHYRALEGQQASYDAAVGEQVFHGVVEPLRDETGRIVGCVGLGLDVTHQRRVEDAFGGKLSAARQKLEALAERSSDLAPEHRALVEDVLESSFVALEELQVTAEELRQQNEELITVHNDLEASQWRYRDLFESAPDGYLVTDRAGVIRRANQAAVELLGVREEVLRDKPLVIYVAEGDRAEFHRRLDRVRAGENPVGVEWEVRVRNRARSAADSAIFPAALMVSPIRDAQGELVGLRWLLRDISPSKRAKERERLLEEARVATEEAQAASTLLRTLLDTMPVGVVVCDAGGSLLMINPPGEEILGSPVYGDIEAPRRTYTPLRPDGSPFPAEDMPLVRAMKRKETVENVEILIRREDGSECTVLAGAAPVRDSAGRVVSGVTVFQDITERKETERERAQVRQALRRYADRLRGLHETDQAILAALSVNEIAEAALHRMPDLLDCVRADVMLYDLDTREMMLLAVHAAGETRAGKGWHGTIDEAWADMLQTLAQGATYTIEDVRQAPSDSPWRKALRAEQVRTLVAVPLIIEGALIGSLNVGMRTPEQLTSEQIDIARELAVQLALGIHQARLREQVQRHADELEQQVQRRTAALQASQARLQAIFDNAAVGIAQVDLQGHVIESNPGLQKMLGYTGEELEGKHFVEFTHPSDAEADEALFQELLIGKRESYSLSKRYIRKDGKQLWGNLHVSFVRDPLGEPCFAVALVEDITAWREAQRALMQSEKLALTGRLAASMAHEINNPLQSVIGCLDLARESLVKGQQADASQMLEIGAEELQRAASIVSQLRDLSRPSELTERELTSVKELVEHVMLLTQKKCLQHHVEIARGLGRDLPRLSVAPNQIQQVFLNLMLNAVEAMPDGGRLVVQATRTGEPDGVCVTFADTGCGIPPDVLPNIFDPFFTTKEEGLGLGLYVTQSIVDAHSGRIDVESQVGKGTTFTVWLPADGE